MHQSICWGHARGRQLLRDVQRRSAHRAGLVGSGGSPEPKSTSMLDGRRLGGGSSVLVRSMS